MKVKKSLDIDLIVEMQNVSTFGCNGNNPTYRSQTFLYRQPLSYPLYFSNYCDAADRKEILNE